MTPFRPVSPARLLIAAVASLVLSIAFIVGLESLLGAVAPSPLLAVVAILGRGLFVAAVVLVVLAAVRKVEARTR